MTTGTTSILTRTAPLDVKRAKTDGRTVELSFASDTPVERYNGVEVLSMKPGAARLQRLLEVGNLVLDHNPADVVGKILAVWYDGPRMRARVRFGESQRASEILADVLDGTRTGVSFAYQVHAAESSRTADGRELLTVTDFEPLEISLSSVPADIAVGTRRSIELNRAHAGPEGNTMSEQNTITVKDADLGVKAERARSREILRLGKEYNLGELAAQFVDNGQPVDAFRRAALETFGSNVSLTPVSPPFTRGPTVGLYGRDLQTYSLTRAIRSHLSKDWQDAGLEREVNRSLEKISGRPAQGVWVPCEIFQRTITAGAGGSGQYLVADDLMAGGFIELLRNESRVVEAGATTLPGLIGDVPIPRHNTGATAHWINEGSNTTASTPAYGSVNLTPKTVSGRVDMTRRMLLQSTPAIDGLVKQDLRDTLGSAVDLASLFGLGSAGEPTGVFYTTGIGDVVGGTNGAAPTYAHMISLMTKVSVANAARGRVGFMTNSEVIGKLRQTQKVTGTDSIMVLEGDTFQGKPVFETNQVPSTLAKVGSSATGAHSAIFYGNFAEILIGSWGAGIDLKIDEVTLGDSGGLVIRAFYDCDIALRHPASFSCMKDATTT